MILAVTQSNIALIGKKQLLDSVFIDHIAAVIRHGANGAYLVHGAELGAVRCISIGDGTTVTERYYAWQI
ncbi:hypothetical protein [Bacteroides rodentium]